MENVLDFFQFSNLMSFFIKAFGIALGIMYVLFAGITMKQVHVMRKAIEVNDNSLFTIGAYIEFGLSVFILFYSLLIL